MVQLLVSVRSVSEAATCIHNGVDLIDIREPARGPLGMVSSERIRAILREVPPRFPVSVSLGEWLDWQRERRLPPLSSGIKHLLMGLSGAGCQGGWREDFLRFSQEITSRPDINSDPTWVAVAYADWKAARSPSPDEVLDFAIANGFPAILLDTFRKDGTSLFDWLPAEAISRLIERARLRGLEAMLGGALRLEEIEKALLLGPQVVAVRSAVCPGYRRDAEIDPDCVRSLVQAFSAAGQHSGIAIH